MAVPLYAAIKNGAFQAAKAKSRLVIPLGAWQTGELAVLDLCQKAHLLVAGDVLGGKTEFVNSAIASLALGSRPEEVQLLLIDVTRVVLTSFNKLPHLVRPVIVDLKEAVDILSWLDREINTRCHELAAAGASHIQVYNASRPAGEPMPYLVVVVYELADLMIGFPSIIEPLIGKIAQQAPQAGIHLIIATQRPAPNVVTAKFKTNFPVRLCFSVVAPEDSRVILDMEGAEDLLEKGDALYLAAKTSKPEYLRGCSLSCDEVDRVVSLLAD